MHLIMLIFKSQLIHQQHIRHSLFCAMSSSDVLKTITRSNNNESFKKASATVHVNIPIQIEPLIATQRCRGPKYIHTHLWWVDNRSIAPHLSTSPVLAVAIDINGVPTMVVTIGTEQPVATLNDHRHNHAIISTAERN
jgi:hypothetical protein